MDVCQVPGTLEKECSFCTPSSTPSFLVYFYSFSIIEEKQIEKWATKATNQFVK
jgi:hypothetical protein